MSDLEIGQVLSLKIRFNNEGVISRSRHPYLIVDIDTELNTVEIAQLDNTLKLELYDGLETYRRQTDKLSQEKLESVLQAYKKYHKDHEIDENKQVYMRQSELEGLQ